MTRVKKCQDEKLQQRCPVVLTLQFLNNKGYLKSKDYLTIMSNASRKLKHDFTIMKLPSIRSFTQDFHYNALNTL
jgi:hypothetical protein